MKNKGTLVLSLALLMILFTASYKYKASELTPNNQEESAEKRVNSNQTVNLFVTHGHCSLPFAGKVNDIKVDAPIQFDLGNPLENMKITFEIDPNTFNVCARKELDPDLTERVKTPGLFINDANEMMRFTSTNVYTMGMDWYQVNGILSIKGVKREIKLFATGIRKPNSNRTHTLILDGQMDLFDWGIDYDLIVSGKSNDVPTKMMHLNMRVDLG